VDGLVIDWVTRVLGSPVNDPYPAVVMSVLNSLEVASGPFPRWRKRE
jgi:hypothetical protein